MRLLPVLVLAILALTSCSGIATSISAPGPKALGAVHSIPVAELGDALGYWNVDWQGRAAQLYAEIAALNTRYCRTHAYVPGEADCNDMAADIWRELASEGIVSLIVVGNLRELLGVQSRVVDRLQWRRICRGSRSDHRQDIPVGGHPEQQQADTVLGGLHLRQAF